MSRAAWFNPFSTRYVRPGSIDYRFRNDEDQSEKQLQCLVTRLVAEREGLIVGPHGSGKTTLLHSLTPMLSRAFSSIAHLRLHACESKNGPRNWIHLHRNAKSVLAEQSRLAPEGLLIVDGAEQLSTLALSALIRRTRRRRQSILATCHAPRCGIGVLHQTDVDPKLVAALTDRLLADARPEVVKMVQAKLRLYDWSTLTNVRDFWFDLYDEVSALNSASQEQAQDGCSTVRHHGSYAVVGDDAK